MGPGAWGGALVASILLVFGMTACENRWTYAGLSLSGPSAVTVTTGQTAMFQVTATGAAPIQYQWMKNGVAIPGATGTSYGTPATAPTDDGTLFSVRVANPYTTVVSGTALLTVVTPVADYPAITTQPVGGGGCSGSGVMLSVTASNATGYQWKLNGVAIAGATGAMYTATLSGTYSVLVSNSIESVQSYAVTVSIGSAITTQPANVTLSLGQVGTFTVAATGQAPFAYQWYGISLGTANGAAIAGATSATYVTAAVGVANDGSMYYATVTDACGTVFTSNPATMTVTFGNVPPTIVLQPVGQLVAVGSTPTFTALAVGTAAITYQWYRIAAGGSVGTAIGGATGTSYTLPVTATTAANNGDQYYVIATNAYGQAASQVVTLAVGTSILIVTQPLSQYVAVGGTATFSVTAQSNLPLTYQWYEAPAGGSQFAAIAGATSSTYSVTNATLSESGSVFQVVVSNTAQSTTSNTAGLFVGSLTQIPGLCDSGWLPHGSTVALGAGTGNCTYQLTDGQGQSGQLVWQSLVATGNVQFGFTITMSNSTKVPADGFTLTLADPAQGAKLTSVGGGGGGLGAKGIPGYVLGFDLYENGPPDAPIVPYVGVTQGNTAQFENPWFNINDNIAPIVVAGQVISTAFVMTLVHGQITVTQNGNLIFSGSGGVVPPTAYLMFTASTGSEYETMVLSNFTGVVGP
jgi:hypothetical protein